MIYTQKFLDYDAIEKCSLAPEKLAYKKKSNPIYCNIAVANRLINWQLDKSVESVSRDFLTQFFS